MKKTTLLALLALTGGSVATQATPVSFTFLENGSNIALGSSSTFTEGSASITAYASPGSTLFAKDDGAGSNEQGLGITSDPTGENEIWGSTFIQLLGVGGLPTVSISFGSTSGGEQALIYASSSLGTLGTLIGTVSSDTSFAIPLADQGLYIGVAAGGSNGGIPNILLGGATVNTPTAADGGLTLTMLGGALTAASLIRRKLAA